MDQPHENPSEAAHEPLSVPSSPNGSFTLPLADMGEDIAQAVLLLQELEVRVKNVQAVNLMIFGAIVLVFALELRELREITR